MSDPFLAEVRIFGCNFAPRNWAMCSGQILPIAQNTALFSLLGTTYGGNGTTTFGLPNLMGRVPISPGNGPGLSNRVIGQQLGAETETLTTTQMPSHTHNLMASNEVGELRAPGATRVLARSQGGSAYIAASGNTPSSMSTTALSPGLGSQQPHNNVMPFLALNFCIALLGIYPSRS